jgi:hypothetical protein
MVLFYAARGVIIISVYCNNGQCHSIIENHFPIELLKVVQIIGLLLLTSTIFIINNN